MKCVLPVGDDLPNAEKQGLLAKVELRVHLSVHGAWEVVEIRLNGVVLAVADKNADGWLVFHLRGALFRRGRNELSFRATTAKPDSGKRTDVLHVEMPVIYKR